MRPIASRYLAGFMILVGLSNAPGHAQTLIMPLGDSITQGGQGHASYRYPALAAGSLAS